LSFLILGAEFDSVERNPLGYMGFLSRQKKQANFIRRGKCLPTNTQGVLTGNSRKHVSNEVSAKHQKRS
jgi:hypothetical protein